MITDADTARKRLKEIRERCLRRSREVLNLWKLIEPRIDSFGNEAYVICEQTCLAALDCGNLELARTLVDKICSKYGASVRMSHLNGLLLEAEEKFEEAEDWYNELLKSNECDLFARKRLIAVGKASGDSPSDIAEEMVKHLAQFPTDYDTWTELSSLYVQQMEYAKAIHCIEELLLAQPHNILYHQRLGELHYSTGGVDHIDQARTYFLHALRLKPDDLRSLYGLYLTLIHSSATGGGGPLAEEVMSKILALHSTKKTSGDQRVVVRNGAALLLHQTPHSNHSTPNFVPTSGSPTAS